MPKKFGVLPGIDVNFCIKAVYKSKGGEEVDGKALNVEHIITHQDICFHFVN